MQITSAARSGTRTAVTGATSVTFRSSSVTPTLQTMVNIDIANDQSAVAPGQDATWGGITIYARKNIRGRFFPTVRAEYYNRPRRVHDRRRAAYRSINFHR